MLDNKTDWEKKPFTT